MLVKFSIPIADDENRKASFWTDWLKPRDARIEQIVSTHLPVLARKRAQMLTKNEYGKYNKKGWGSELSYFLTDVLIPELPWWHSLRQEPPSVHALTRAAKIVDGLLVAECRRLREEFGSDQVPEEGWEYERYCQALLEKHGWQVQLTKATCDQGVDLLGRYRERLVAFQCKRFRQPVGNKAVQEVVAGREYYKAHLAVVVTNAQFTSAARSLASASKVHLLHHSELEDFGNKIAPE
jgi:restriction system protein